MALRKNILLVFAAAFIFTGCHNLCSDLENTIGTTCWNEKLYWEDVSAKNDYNFSGNSRYSLITENGEPVIKVSSGSGNWSLSSLGMDIKGYEVQVKCASNSKIAGIQLYSSYTDYRAIEVYIRSGGKVDVRYMDKSGNEKTLFTSGKIIDDITVYNTIYLELQDDRSVKICINGKSIYTVDGYSIVYGLLTMQMNSSGYTYYKIKKVMH